eukprot:3563773-Rhodomonas_salina.1
MQWYISGFPASSHSLESLPPMSTTRKTPAKGHCTECSLPVKGDRYKFNGDMHSGCAPPCGEEPAADNIPAFIKQKYCPACGLELGDEVKTAPLYMCAKCVRPASSKKRKEAPLSDLQRALS